LETVGNIIIATSPLKLFESNAHTLEGKKIMKDSNKLKASARMPKTLDATIYEDQGKVSSKKPAPNTEHTLNYTGQTTSNTSEPKNTAMTAQVWKTPAQRKTRAAQLTAAYAPSTKATPHWQLSI
jgi:hypothetical protein